MIAKTGKTKVWVFFNIIAFLWTNLAIAAVLQEPIEGQPEKFKTRYLSGENFTPPNPSVQYPMSPDSISSTGSTEPVLSKPKGSLQTSLTTREGITLTPQQGSSVEIQPDRFIESIQTSSIHPSIHARYEKIGLESLRNILKRYKSIPGGVTLEGLGKGFPEIKKVLYDSRQNAFILNDQWLYQNPVSRPEMKEIFHAIAKDDLIGVSLGDKNLVYGTLPEGSLPIIYLKMADHLLGCIVFANDPWVRLHTFPGGYQPKKHTQTGGSYAVYFNFSDFAFQEEEGGIKPLDANLTVTLIPLTPQKDTNGGYIPDLLKIEKGLLPREYEENIFHIVQNISAYQNEARIQKTIRYGEAAAFARRLKESSSHLFQILLQEID